MNIFQGRGAHRFARVAAAIGIALVCASALYGCAGEGADQTNEEIATYADIENMDLEYTDRDKRDTYDEASATKIALTGDSASVEGEGVRVDGSNVSIESEGTYVVSGALDNGQLRVNVGDTEKVQIVLAGATIKNESSAALFVEQADKCFITLAAGTKNELADSAEYAFAEGEDEPNATLFSKDDLTINGTGELSVTGNYEHAIYSKDDLVITGGAFDVSAVKDGLRGKDSLKILDGTFAVEAGEDCLKASRDDDPTRGFVVIDGGTFTLNAGDDAIHGETYLLVKGGTIDIPTCVEGLEAMVVQVDGGDIDVVAQDDAINAAAPSVSSDAQADAESAPGDGIEAGERGLKGDRGEMGGEMNLDANDQTDGEKSFQKPEGMKGERPALDAEDASQNGERSFKGRMQDDATGEQDGSSDQRVPEGDLPEDFADDLGGFEGFDDLTDLPEGMEGQKGGFGGGMDEGNESCQIIINGGTITLEAKGDAIDSNGSLQVNGGTVYVTGPTSGGDGALDYALDAACDGGTILIAGPSRMAQNFSEGTQPFVFTQVNGKANQTVTVKDQVGDTLISYAPKADFETIIVSSPDFVDGQTYTLVVGDSQTKITPTTSQVGQKA